MTTDRLEAFSDGVMAILITIMVLDLRPPNDVSMHGIFLLLPHFFAYMFSFAVIAIYWNNHHHLMLATEKITVWVMWANMILLFCLSLIPFATAWLGTVNHLTAFGPVMVYCLVAFFCSAAYYFLEQNIVAANPNGQLSQEIGKDKKGPLSMVLLLGASVLSFFSTILALCLVFLSGVMWFVPDKRIEKILE